MKDNIFKTVQKAQSLSFSGLYTIHWHLSSVLLCRTASSNEIKLILVVCPILTLTQGYLMYSIFFIQTIPEQKLTNDNDAEIIF